MLLAIFIDHKVTNSFKGTDSSHVGAVDRLQLDEREDVVRHREFSKDIWDTSHHQD